ncbi:MAG: hypothetical protein IJE16_08990 [Ruminococcus sp.]|nr:hypothetical protein [Ruminococcus sp.]
MKITKKLSLVLVIILLILSLFGCGAKEAKTPEEFKSFMEGKGFTVVDSTLFAQDIIKADTVLTALGDNYEIDYYELSTQTGASSLFELNKEAFENEETAVNLTTHLSSDNFDYYSLVSDTGFHMTARVDNTVVYCYTDAEYKDEIVELITELGYK